MHVNYSPTILVAVEPYHHQGLPAAVSNLECVSRANQSASKSTIGVGMLTRAFYGNRSGLIEDVMYSIRIGKPRESCGFYPIAIVGRMTDHRSEPGGPEA